MSASIQPVDIKYVNQVWPQVKEFLSQSFEKGMPNGEHNYTLDQLWTYVTTGQWMLIVAVEENNITGAMTVSFVNYPLHRIAFVTATGGRSIIDKDTLEQLKAIVKHNGATKIQAMARPSMCKLLKNQGFYTGNTLMECKL